MHGALQFCANHAASLRERVIDLPTLQSWRTQHPAEVDRNPSAWCAIELALLEVIAKSEGSSVERLLGLPGISGRFRYTAVLGDASPAAFEALLARYQKAGFAAFKVKLSGDVDHDRAKVGALRRAGVAPSAVRADANNVWRDAGDAIAALKALGFDFWAIEEPLSAGDFLGMSTIANEMGARIVLDESVLRAAQLDALAADPDRWIVNLRVSKMGGLLRSLEVAAAVTQRRMKLIVGAHVGETSVLTRAALTVAHAFADAVVAQEGAVGTHLLARDVADPPLMFGAGGVLDVSAARLAGAGWGLSIPR